MVAIFFFSFTNCSLDAIDTSSLGTSTYFAEVTIPIVTIQVVGQKLYCRHWYYLLESSIF